MADKVVNSGIEDVLSSIKRLVSEEDRKIPGLLSSSGVRKPGRLVLTDALRVGKPAEDGDQPQPKDEPAYKAEDSVKPMILRACDIVKHAEPAVEQQTQSDPESDAADSLSAKIEALEAAIARTEDQWEPDGDSDDAYSGTPTKTLEWAEEDGATEAEGEAEQIAAVTTPSKLLEGHEQQETAKVETAVETEQPEPVISAASSEEALTAEVETENGDVMAEAEQTEPFTTATFIRDPDVFNLTSKIPPEGPEQTEPFTTATFIRDPDVFNLTSKIPPEGPEQTTSLNMEEAALRELIAEVVREELQGVLGERITRNVRKMVRREIYRALAEQKLE